MGLLPAVIVELRGQISDLQVKLGQAKTELDTMQSRGESFASKFSAAGTMAFAAVGTAAIGLGTEAIHLADAFEVSHARLTASLLANGTSFDTWSKQIQGADNAGQKLAFSNAQVEDGLARLESMVHNPAAAIRDLAVAEDLARARGIDLTSASQMVGRAADGNYTSLVKLGVITKEQAKNFTSGAQAVDFLGKAFAGQASTYADTFSGKLQVLKVTSEDVGKNVGLILIPAIEGVATAAANGTQWIIQHEALLKELGVVVAATVTPALLRMGAALLGDALAGLTAAGSAVVEFLIPSSALALNLDADAAAAGAAGIAFDSMLGPIGLVAGVLTALGIQLLRSGDSIKSNTVYANDFAQALGSIPDKGPAITAQITTLKAQIDDLSLKWKTAAEAGSSTAPALDKQITTLKGDVKGLQDQLTGMAAAQKASSDATDAQTKAAAAYLATLVPLAPLTGAWADTSETAAQKTHDLYLQSLQAASAAKDEKDKIDQIKSALDALIGTHVSYAQANATFAQDLLDDTAKLAAAKTGIDLHTGAIKWNTQAGVDLSKQLTQNASDIQSVYDATLSLTGSTDDAALAVKNNTDQFDAQLKKLGLTPAAIQAVNAQYGLIPSQISTALTATVDINTQAALDAIAGLHKAGETIFSTGAKTVVGPHAVAAQGTLTSGPTLAGEGRYPEFVIPLDPMYRSNAVALTKQLLKTLPGLAGGGIAGPMAGFAAQYRTADFDTIWSTQDTINAAANTAMAALTASINAATSAAPAAGVVPPGGASAWTGVATAVAAMLGQSGSVGAIIRRIMFESGGNPTAVNRTDINWQHGTPSVGLAQVISPTFAHYAGQYLGTPPFAYGVSEDPMANVYAGMRYATARYGSIAAIDPLIMPHGYDQGGILPPGLTMAMNNTGRNEYVSRSPGGGGVTNINVTINGAVMGATADQIAAAMVEPIAKAMRQKSRGGWKLGAG